MPMTTGKWIKMASLSRDIQAFSAETRRKSSSPSGLNKRSPGVEHGARQARHSHAIYLNGYDSEDGQKMGRLLCKPHMGL